jgi:hypothetical protein
MGDWIKRKLQCLWRGHRFAFDRNIYGDEILMAGGRSWWVCEHCGASRVRAELHHAAPTKKSASENASRQGGASPGVTDFSSPASGSLADRHPLYVGGLAHEQASAALSPPPRSEGADRG